MTVGKTPGAKPVRKPKKGSAKKGSTKKGK